ncbi:MAG TPA: ABC transporter permease [Terriglobales bacterium]|nr:ABC transporter permease [Terriglobales bacterium]
MNRLRQDVAYALRGLRREPGFALTAVLTLALAIAANTAVFGVIQAVLLRPLPLRQPDRVLWMAPRSSACGLSCETWSVDAYRGFIEQNHSFASVAAYMPFNPADNLRLTAQGQQLPVTGVDVTSNFFQTLGVVPYAGRLFEPADSQTGAAPVALLAYAYWRRQFNADPHLVGTTIDLDGQPVTVAGILPADFDFGAVFWPGVRVDLFTPAVLDRMINWGNTLSLVGRLRPGVTVAQAQADANSVTPRLYFRTTIPSTYGSYRRRPMDLMTLQAHASGALRRPLLFTWFAVGALLLIACVNLANLMLARAARRGQEFALRAALGAGRGRLLRQWMTESLVLAAAGAAVGWLIAAALVAFLVHRGSQALPLLAGTRLDAAVLLWTCLTAAAAALLFGLMPGWQAAGADP